MGISISGIQAYNPVTNLLSSTAAHAFTGINAMAGLVSDRKILQSGNYKRLLKEYYALEETGEKAAKKTAIRSIVKSEDKRLTENRQKVETQDSQQTSKLSAQEARDAWEQFKKTSYDATGNYGQINIDQINNIFNALA